MFVVYLPRRKYSSLQQPSLGPIETNQSSVRFGQGWTVESGTLTENEMDLCSLARAVIKDLCCYLCTWAVQ